MQRGGFRVYRQLHIYGTVSSTVHEERDEIALKSLLYYIPLYIAAEASQHSNEERQEKRVLLRLIVRASGRCLGPFLFPFFLYAECIWTAGRLGTATFGALFRFSPFFLAQQWLLSFRFLVLPFVGLSAAKRCKTGRCRACWFSFRFLRRGERREEEALRESSLSGFVFCAFLCVGFLLLLLAFCAAVGFTGLFPVTFFIGKG